MCVSGFAMCVSGIAICESYFKLRRNNLNEKLNFYHHICVCFIIFKIRNSNLGLLDYSFGLRLPSKIENFKSNIFQVHGRQNEGKICFLTKSLFLNEI